MPTNNVTLKTPEMQFLHHVTLPLDMYWPDVTRRKEARKESQYYCVG
jgi:hypothetical protein